MTLLTNQRSVVQPKKGLQICDLCSCRYRDLEKHRNGTTQTCQRNLTKQTADRNEESLKADGWVRAGNFHAVVHTSCAPQVRAKTSVDASGVELVEETWTKRWVLPIACDTNVPADARRFAIACHVVAKMRGNDELLQVMDATLALTDVRGLVKFCKGGLPDDVRRCAQEAAARCKAAGRGARTEGSEEREEGSE